ncbi:hypothetical protein CERZMDRAFT_82981 [Cercospora zeae-maydis SCOH1-5]|uniref:Myb-like domain-containing protein n=1 Tax=Cercospora zeae-maydis SCOH1-5 TaxID=717836 RepID=A0A6A6FLI1_9PEZI|nr:hypothetical protein CERZMDRAFT_82981 [Cercospora zeae-maydis SCOH1-5]
MIKCFAAVRKLSIGPARPVVCHPAPRLLATVTSSRAAKEESAAPTVVRNTRHYSQADDALIVLRRKQGASLKEIAAALGRSATSVGLRHRRLVRMYGFEGEVRKYRASRRVLFSPSDDAHILQRRAEGAAFVTIAHELPQTQPVSDYQVCYRWHDLVCRGDGLQVSDVETRRQRMSRGMTDSDYKHILALREQGLKWREIASRLQLDMGTMHRLFYERSTAVKGHRSWDTAEVAAMIRLREQEHRSWCDIARVMNRSYTSVRTQYIKVRPHGSGCSRRVASPWTRTDDEKLLHLVKQHGTRWSLLQRLMGSRTAVALRNRYWGYLQRSDPLKDVPATLDAKNAKLDTGS